MCRYVKSRSPSRSRGYSSAIGSFTLSKSSESPHRSSVATTCGRLTRPCSDVAAPSAFWRKAFCVMPANANEAMTKFTPRSRRQNRPRISDVGMDDRVTRTSATPRGREVCSWNQARVIMPNPIWATTAREISPIQKRTDTARTTIATVRPKSKAPAGPAQVRSFGPPRTKRASTTAPTPRAESDRGGAYILQTPLRRWVLAADNGTVLAASADVPGSE